MIFVHIARSPAIRKTNIERSSPILRKNIKEITVSIDIIIIMEEIIIIKENLRNLEY
jgi:hypothetical protein